MPGREPERHPMKWKGFGREPERDTGRPEGRITKTNKIRRCREDTGMKMELKEDSVHEGSHGITLIFQIEYKTY
jgi:hypothetical protein